MTSRILPHYNPYITVHYLSHNLHIYPLYFIYTCTRTVLIIICVDRSPSKSRQRYEEETVAAGNCTLQTVLTGFFPFGWGRIMGARKRVRGKALFLS